MAAKRPRLVDGTKQVRYIRALNRGLLDGADICGGCPYGQGCCRHGHTLWSVDEAIAVEKATGKSHIGFAVRMRRPFLGREFEGKTPCRFLSRGGSCQVYALRPLACRSGVCDYAYRRFEEVSVDAGVT